jgi:hypothetical protein
MPPQKYHVLKEDDIIGGHGGKDGYSTQAIICYNDYYGLIETKRKEPNTSKQEY